MTDMTTPSIRQTTLAAGALAGAWAGSAGAQDAPGGHVGPTFSASAGAASDYLFRGVSRSADRAEGFGSADMAYADSYAGVWASSAAFAVPGQHVRTGAEIDAYAGWRPEFRGYSLDVGAQYTVFAGLPMAVGEGYVEVHAKASRSIGPVTGHLGLRYSPDFFAHGGQAWYGEAGADYALAPDWTLSAGAGYQSVEHPSVLQRGEYATWNAGVTHTFAGHLAVDLRYSATDHPTFLPTYDGRLVGQIRASF
jgi:uncharacterized protein (TIGR02001 family)